jgi:hypothetical protein
MKKEFSYIRNRIREYRKEDIIDYSYQLLDLNKNDFKPIWFVFLLMKWTYLYGGEKHPSKKLTFEKFNQILKGIADFNQEHISNFIVSGKIDRAMSIYFSQQFYLQKVVHKEVFALQLKLYKSIAGRYDIQKSFKEKTGLSIVEFLFLSQIFWLYVQSAKNKETNLNFNGHLEIDFLNVCAEMTSTKQVTNFIELIVLDPENSKEKINNFKRNLRSEDLQSLERTFFTMYPFQIFNGKIKLIHESVFNYFINYYVYDFLKSYDKNFTTEFGDRFEKYIGISLKEVKLNFLNENELKKKLKVNSNLVDFCISESNVYIECKAIELQPIPQVNPTDEILYNSLKDSILKAYYKQLLNVSKALNTEKQNWGLIITYKELCWSRFNELFEMSKDKFENSKDSHYLPPENVFILDIYSWNTIIQILKDGKATIVEILEKARENNSKPETRKQLFSMHLDEYKVYNFDLNFLKKEIEELEIKNK